MEASQANKAKKEEFTEEDEEFSEEDEEFPERDEDFLDVDSVMPSVLAIQDAQGWKLQEQQPSKKNIITGIGISALVTLISALFISRAFSSFMALEADQLTNEIEVMAIAGIFFAAAAIYCYKSIQDLRLINVVGPAELIIEKLPLRLNQTVRVQYHRKLHQSLDITQVSAKLACTEYVRFRRGTDTVSESSEIWQQELPVHMSPSGYHGDLHFAWTITIPADQPSSFMANNNRIEWTVKVTVEIANHPDAEALFLLPVLPEVLI